MLQNPKGLCCVSHIGVCQRLQMLSPPLSLQVPLDPLGLTANLTGYLAWQPVSVKDASLMGPHRKLVIFWITE